MTTFDIWIKWKDKAEPGGWSGWYMTQAHRKLSFAEAIARLARVIANEIKMRKQGGNGAAVYVIVPSIKTNKKENE